MAVTSEANATAERRSAPAYTTECFTLHVRLTKFCQAGCTYCSSWVGARRGDYMHPGEFERSLRYIVQLWDRLGIRPRRASVQYVGGEVLTVPMPALEEMVDIARRVLGERCEEVIDGIQTNLLGSVGKVEALRELFAGRVATSVDHHTGQRRLGGSARTYRLHFARRDELLALTGRRVPAVYVLDQQGLGHAVEEMRIANRQGRTLTLRMAFLGGSPDVRVARAEAMAATFLACFDAWYRRMGIVVEPLFTLLLRRVNDHLPEREERVREPGCHWQQDCTQRSLNLEPNGDLYLCLEHADAGRGRFGNALRGEFDPEAWGCFASRAGNLDPRCRSCRFLPSCQGGCMAEAMEEGHGVRGRPDLCVAWTALFTRMDEIIARDGAPQVRRWLDRIEARAEEGL